MIRARVRLFGGEVVPDVFDLCFKKVHEAVAVIRGGVVVEELQGLSI